MSYYFTSGCNDIMVLKYSSANHFLHLFLPVDVSLSLIQYDYLPCPSLSTYISLTSPTEEVRSKKSPFDHYCNVNTTLSLYLSLPIPQHAI